jgi:hypothetical protein
VGRRVTRLSLDGDQLAQLADLVADRLAQRLATNDSHALVDASEIARRHGLTRSWCYDHAAELGAIRIGSGSRPRLRFNPELVERHLANAAGQTVAPVAATPRRRTRQQESRTASGAPLLHVGAGTRLPDTTMRTRTAQ